MAIIHSTATLSPTKLELLASWLPAQPWYLGHGREPELARAGGFRLDDPRGEVGIEFMVVTDGSGERAASYLVPMTYRASALTSADGADGALIGTAEHSVLGRRWIYDGVHDPVFDAQLVALIQGDAEPQAQSVSDSPDPTVISEPVAGGSLTATGSAVAASEPSGTVLRVETAGADGVRDGQLIVRVSRVLQPDGTAASAASATSATSAAPGASAVPGASAAEAGQPCLTATWRLPDGTSVRGIMASARYTPLAATSMPNITGVLARVYVDDIDAALELYQSLSGGQEPARFKFRDVDLARVGPFLLLSGNTASYRNRVATLLVRDLEPVINDVERTGGQILEGPSPAPNGRRLIAHHRDGSVFEYIEGA
jgi:hypothetical protein